VLVVSKGVVPPLGTLPSAYAAERVPARAVATLAGPSHAADALDHGASVVLATVDETFACELAAVLRDAGFDVETSRDVVGVELAGCAKNAAARAAAAAAAAAGPNVAGAAAGKVFAELGALARTRGCEPATFAGLAGAGDLVATVVADGSRNRRAGELLAKGVPAGEIANALGQAAEAVDSVPLLAAMLREARVRAPATTALAALVEGRIDAAQWTASVTRPAVAPRRAKAA
jgi:glycerol-3-phosphate dehydrogenase